ncbi:AAA family ATPase [Ferrimonas sp. SCSIO 43195]|uniref:AAA family ATPase n=1 Tax=Ferrimonas sp. SCSIO 43195 TaxID=2822844 RepID=UPI002075685A|nr:AAA family ATPase [Ferrimonas sp. SCSIO 43195]USD36507.1 AAA family ATPase [Ferrimonas sp. SCSIO 43195]
MNSEVNHPSASTANQLAIKPASMAAVGVDPQLLQSLLLKHLLDGDVLTMENLNQRLALTGTLVQQLLDNAKQNSLVENKQTTSDGQMRYTLSHLGREQAEYALSRSGYLGPVPVPLDQYWRVCRLQSSRQHTITRPIINQALDGLVLPHRLMEEIGPALNSKRPVLIYGPPGTGKSYLCRHFNQVFGDDVLIPHAIAIGQAIIQIFDPQLHELHESNGDNQSLLLTEGHDPRWHRCRRPLLVVGGELTQEMLNVHYDHNSRTYHAPIGLKSNNGILLVDDLGRQQITPKEIFNRWIVPMEESKDFLSLPSGEHFDVPFEQILLFSTNLDPEQLVDDAFLRRLGYKIQFAALNKEQFSDIWRQNCHDFNLNYDPHICDWIIANLYEPASKPLLPCHPRDLLSIVADQISYNELPAEVTQQLLQRAWSIYFVNSAH